MTKVKTSGITDNQNNAKHYCIPYEIDRQSALALGAKPEEIIKIKIGARMTTGIMIPVSKEVYEFYMHDIWNTEKAKERKGRCLITSEKTGRIIRCENKNCSMCKKGELEKEKCSQVSLDQFLEDNDYEPGELVSPDSTNIILDGVVLETLLDILKKQDPRYATVFQMVYDCHSTREIAESVGISQTYARELIAKARAILQQHVKKEDLM